VVKDAQKLLGALVSHINIISFAADLSSKMDKTMKKIENTFNYDDDM